MNHTIMLFKNLKIEKNVIKVENHTTLLICMWAWPVFPCLQLEESHPPLARPAQLTCTQNSCLSCIRRWYCRHTKLWKSWDNVFLFDTLIFDTVYMYKLTPKNCFFIFRFTSIIIIQINSIQNLQIKCTTKTYRLFQCFTPRLSNVQITFNEKIKISEHTVYKLCFPSVMSVVHLLFSLDIIESHTPTAGHQNC